MQPSKTGWGLKLDDKYKRKNKNEKTNSYKHPAANCGSNN